MNILALLTDAFGGYGGIALYNRDVLSALCSHPEVEQVVALPRSISNALESLPGKLHYNIPAAKGAPAYLAAVTKELLKGGKYDLVLCAHINLIPVAWLFAKLLKVPLILQVYGIDAWQPTARSFTNRWVASVDMVISISNYTTDRFLEWSQVSSERCRLLPNAIDLKKYGEDEKSLELMKKYGLAGKAVLMTLGRMSSEEQYKGFDKVLELLPELKKKIPKIVYVIAGDGDDRPNLEEKAQLLEVADSVVFTGMVDEAEKADLYRVADLYVMPSRGEGFGFVFLEAMACGIPVVASLVDGSRDAVRDGRLGIMVDPDDREELLQAIIQGLEQPKGIPVGLEYFSFENFTRRLHAIVDETLDQGRKQS